MAPSVQLTPSSHEGHEGGVPPAQPSLKDELCSSYMKCDFVKICNSY